MYRHQKLILGMVLIVALGLCLPVCGAVSLPHVFSDHMVLQQQKPVVVWGWAAPDEAVQVQLGNQQAGAKADANGNWQVSLPPLTASADPIEMTVKGTNAITIKDILVGEVWLCSGQSNMEWGLGGAETGPQEVPQANFPQIRILQINARPNPYPVTDMGDSWQICQPQTVGGFTAVGYFFGKNLHQELKVPVGLIEAAWGGTRIEPWTPRVGFESQPALAEQVKWLDQAESNYRGQLPEQIKSIESWIAATREALAANRQVPVAPNWPRHPVYADGHPTEPTCLYNTRIYPIVPFALRGAIWYQGESNMGEGMLYCEKTKGLVEGWRKVWNDSSLSFYFVQLAPYRHYGPDDLPRLWEAQTASLAIPGTGMAVIHDIGNIEDIHPRNKHEVGRRLALWALAKNYGRSDTVYSGPLYRTLKVQGDTAVIEFDHTAGGLATRDGKAPSWFEIAGEDKEFHPANARIEGDTVLVSCDQVKQPVAVRFAWDNIAEPNLMNKAGLPANSFRTDKW